MYGGTRVGMRAGSEVNEYGWVHVWVGMGRAVGLGMITHREGYM